MKFGGDESTFGQLSRLCFECCTKCISFIVDDEHSKGLSLQGDAVKRAGISEDFWSTSTWEMENSGVQSQRGISSRSTSIQILDQQGLGSSGGSEFVNHGLLLWNRTREQWVGNKMPDDHRQQVRQPRLSWNATYDSLLGTNKPFPKPIPLPEMVDFLVDEWEQEGLYD